MAVKHPGGAVRRKLNVNGKRSVGSTHAQRTVCPASVVTVTVTMIKMS